MVEDENCDACNVLETPEQVLFDCSVYRDIRASYLAKNKINNKNDLFRIRDDNMADFQKFCELAIKDLVRRRGGS